MPSHKSRTFSTNPEVLEAVKAALPELPPQAHMRINAARERCDAMVAKAERRYARLIRDADLIEDSRRSRALRNKACDLRQAAHDKAAVSLLDAQAAEYMPLTGVRFQYQTLEVLAQTAAEMYGGEEAVPLRQCEWRARWLERKAAEEPKPATEVKPDRQRGKQPDPVAIERTALMAEYKVKARHQGIKVSDEMIAKAAKPGKWNDRTMVTWWKRNDPRCKQPHDKKIRAVLKLDPSSIWEPNLRSKRPPK